MSNYFNTGTAPTVPPPQCKPPPPPTGAAPYQPTLLRCRVNIRIIRPGYPLFAVDEEIRQMFYVPPMRYWWFGSWPNNPFAVATWVRCTADQTTQLYEDLFTLDLGPPVPTLSDGHLQEPPITFDPFRTRHAAFTWNELPDWLITYNWTIYDGIIKSGPSN